MDLDNLSSAVLTPAQREYITSDENDKEQVSGVDERAMRARIRERFKAGIYDMYLLSMFMEDRDRKQALADMDVIDPETGDKMMVYYNYLMPMLRFLFAGLLDPETQTDGFDTPEEMFTTLLEYTIKNSFPQRGLAIEDINVEISVERGEQFDDPTPADLADQPLDVLRQMSAGSKLTHEQFQEIIKSREDIIRVKDNSDSNLVSKLVQLDRD
ncbi:MAG TPA: hypothetical protein VFJ06_14245 [Halococcus sp.]|nr:hypothetical protein [Halococcus sp.]